MVASYEVTVAERIRSYFDDVNKSNRHSTTAIYKNYMNNYIEPYFKDVPINELTSELIQGLILHLEESGLSAGTIHTIYSYIKAGLKPIINNITADIVLPKKRKQQIDIFSPSEQERLLTAAKEIGYPVYPAVLIPLFSGLMPGELCGLMWSDFNFSLKTIRVRRTLRRVPVYNGGKAKTNIVIYEHGDDNLFRSIQLPGFLMKLMQSYKKDYQYEYILSSNGKHIEPRYLHTSFKKLLNDAGIRNVNFSTLRHTYAVRSMERGIDINILSKALGYASATAMLNRYEKVLKNHKISITSKYE